MFRRSEGTPEKRQDELSIPDTSVVIGAKTQSQPHKSSVSRKRTKTNHRNPGPQLSPTTKRSTMQLKDFCSWRDLTETLSNVTPPHILKTAAAKQRTNTTTFFKTAKQHSHRREGEQKNEKEKMPEHLPAGIGVGLHWTLPEKCKRLLGLWANSFVHGWKATQ